MSKVLNRIIFILASILIALSCYFAGSLPAGQRLLYDLESNTKFISGYLLFVFLTCCFTRVIIKRNSSLILIMLAGILFNFIQLSSRAQYFETEYLPAYFKSYDLYSISINCPNELIKKQYSSFLGLRKYLSGSNLYKISNSVLESSTTFLKDVSGVRNLTIDHYQENLSEDEFREFIKNKEIQKYPNLQKDIYIIPNIDKRYRLYNFQGNLILKMS